MVTRAGVGAEEIIGASFRETGGVGARAEAGSSVAERLMSEGAGDSEVVVAVADLTAVAAVGGKIEKLIFAVTWRRLRGDATNLFWQISSEG
jgi:hypothetical protein